VLAKSAHLILVNKAFAFSICSTEIKPYGILVLSM